MRVDASSMGSDTDSREKSRNGENEYGQDANIRVIAYASLRLATVNVNALATHYSSCPEGDAPPCPIHARIIITWGGFSPIVLLCLPFNDKPCTFSVTVRPSFIINTLRDPGSFKNFFLSPFLERKYVGFNRNDTRSIENSTSSPIIKISKKKKGRTKCRSNPKSVEMDAVFSRITYTKTKRKWKGNKGGRKGKEGTPERRASWGVNSRRIFMGRLVEQGLRKLVNRLIALNDERRDFSGNTG